MCPISFDTQVPLGYLSFFPNATAVWWRKARKEKSLIAVSFPGHLVLKELTINSDGLHLCPRGVCVCTGSTEDTD